MNFQFLRFIIVFTILIQLNFSSAFGEEEITFPQLSPVSPNAAALGEYGSIPVGYYTGVPNINIPISSIKLDNKEFPITLSYHASGIKVVQESSTVGLGWVLNAGGCITKEIRGWDDFQSSPKGYYFDTDLPAPDSNNDRNTTLSPEELEIIRSYVVGNYDSEPDLFHYNLGIYSGTCFFKKNGFDGNTANLAIPIIRNGKDYVKLQYFILGGAYNLYDYWIATDSDGFKYYFHTNEKTESHISSANVERNYFQYKPDQANAITSWYLDSIVSPLKNKITFLYEKMDYIYSQITYSESKTKIIDVDSDCGISSYLNVNQYSHPYSFSKNEQKLLTGITFPNGKITINYSDREDIESVYSGTKAKKIDNIVVSNNSTDIKRIELKQSYMGNISLPSFQKRLILDSLKIEDKIFSFLYYKKWMGLPIKSIEHTDYWGYSNNSNANLSGAFRLAPSYTYKDLSGVTQVLQGKDNNPNLEYMEIGSLVSIKFPTGGKTDFEYEMHDFSNDIGFRSLEKVLDVHSYFYDDQNPSDSEFNENGDDFAVTDETLYAKVKINYYRYHSDNIPDADLVNSTIIIQRKESGVYSNIIQYNLELSTSSQNIENSLKFPSAGDYRIKIISDSTYYPDITVYVRSTFTEQIKKGGGLRIKSISSYFDDDNFIKHTYNYSKDGISTGLHMNKLDNIIRFEDAFQTNYLNGDDVFDLGNMCSSHILGVLAKSNPYTPFSYSASGQSVGYSYVEDVITSSNEKLNGKTTYKFSNKVDKVIETNDRIINNYPSIPYLNNGNLIETAYYDNQDHIVRKEILKYTKVNSDSIKGLLCYKPGIYTGISGSWVSLKYYDLYSERWVLSEKLDSLFDGDNCVTSQTEYQYNDFNWLLKNKKTYDSNNNLIEDRFTYPTDYSTSPYNSMVNNMIISPIIEKATYKNNNFIKKIKSEYKDWGANNFFPEKVSVQYGNNSPISKVSYVKYDIANGNLLGFSNQQDLHTYYVWGYNKTYPVAKIESPNNLNIDLEVIDSNLSNSDDLSDIQDDITYLKTLLTTYLNNKDYMVTMYTYKPLVGMTSMTDPRGVTTYYEYDAFNRLKYTKDKDGNVLQNNAYHYSIQQ